MGDDAIYRQCRAVYSRLIAEFANKAKLFPRFLVEKLGGLFPDGFVNLVAFDVVRSKLWFCINSRDSAATFLGEGDCTT